MTMVFHVGDNSGAKLAKGISTRGFKRFQAKLGCIIRVSIASADPKSSVKKGSKHLAVILSLRKPTNRSNGMTVRSNKNSIALLDTEGKKMLASRILVPVSSEVRATCPDAVSRTKEEVY